MKTVKKPAKVLAQVQEAPAPRTLGYARVSTDEQNLDLQLTALRNAGCHEIFEDHISGRTTSRPALDRLMQSLRPGDTLAVWKLDRLGRRVVHLVGLMEELRVACIEFRSMTEGMDTRTVMGRAMFQLVAVFAEMERGQMHERITAGIAAAKAAGVHCGRRRSLTPVHVDDARTKIQNGWSFARTATFHGVSRTTLYTALRRADEDHAARQSGLLPIRRRRGRPRAIGVKSSTVATL
jgi:DNA invertase Pin-like site-specific DNA recombinase